MAFTKDVENCNTLSKMGRKKIALEKAFLRSFLFSRASSLHQDHIKPNSTCLYDVDTLYNIIHGSKRDFIS